MEPSDSSNEAEIAVLLAGRGPGDVENIKRGLAMVFHLWARPVFGLVRAAHPYLTSEDLADVWQDTVKQLAIRVRAGTLRREGSLFALVSTIARRLGGRRSRQGAVRRSVPLFDEIEDARNRRGWADLDDAEREEVLEITRSAIPSLPPRAATVMDVFVDRFPETTSMERLRVLVSERTGRQETLPGVKRALQDAREGLRDRLRRRGYDFRTGGDR